MEYMFCHLLTYQKIYSFGRHGNQGVNTCIIGLFWKFIVGIRLYHGKSM